jgi:hypothetical protein
MTISEAYDRLLAAPVSVIEWNDGDGPLRCPEPMVVRHISDIEHAEIWLESSDEGLCLHFNAKDQYGEWRGHTEPLSNIARIA